MKCMVKNVKKNLALQVYDNIIMLINYHFSIQKHCDKLNKRQKMKYDYNTLTIY